MISGSSLWKSALGKATVRQSAVTTALETALETSKPILVCIIGNSKEGDRVKPV